MPLSLQNIETLANAHWDCHESSLRLWTNIMVQGSVCWREPRKARHLGEDAQPKQQQDHYIEKLKNKNKININTRNITAEKTDNISKEEKVENWKLLLHMSFHIRLSVNKKQTTKTTAKAAKQLPLKCKMVLNWNEDKPGPLLQETGLITTSETLMAACFDWLWPTCKEF